jgi:hypothetical protein
MPSKKRSAAVFGCILCAAAIFELNLSASQIHLALGIAALWVMLWLALGEMDTGAKRVDPDDWERDEK